MDFTVSVSMFAPGGVLAFGKTHVGSIPSVGGLPKGDLESASFMAYCV